MLKRAWLVIAAMWAVLLFGIAIADGSGSESPAFYAIALGPFAVPLLLRWFFGYVIFGVRPGRPLPARLPRQ